MRGASAIQQVIEPIPNSKIRLFIVWEPILVTDWMAPTRFTLARIEDLRAFQYWDRQHLVAQALRQALQIYPPPGDGAARLRSPILWDDVAVYPPRTQWNGSLPPVALFGGTVVRMKPAFQRSLEDLLRGEESSTPGAEHTTPATTATPGGESCQGPAKSKNSTPPSR